MDRILHTERLTLRPIKMSDAKDISVLGGDLEIARMTGSIPHPFPLLAAEIRVMMFDAAWRRGAEYSYAICKTGGNFMGIAGLFRRSESCSYELGYWLGRPYWGKGYMSEACAAILKAGQSQLGLTTFVAGVFADNPGSMAVLRKLGFKTTGAKEQYFSMARGCKAESHGFLFENAAPGGVA